MSCIAASIGYELWLTSQAFHAVTANLANIAKSSDITDLEVLNGRADLLDDSDALVSESNIGVSVVKVGAAEAGVGHLKENIVRAKFSGNSLANGGLALSTAEDFKGNLAAHIDCVDVVL